MYIDGFEKFLFDSKKVIYPPLTFCIGSYRFSKVKCAPDFVKELESFHFEKKRVRRNYSSDKVSAYCASVGVHFEYTHHWDKDEEIYRNSCNMASLSRRFKTKITTVGEKGSSSGTAQQQNQNEEVARKRKEEAQRLL